MESDTVIAKVICIFTCGEASPPKPPETTTMDYSTTLASLLSTDNGFAQFVTDQIPNVTVTDPSTILTNGSTDTWRQIGDGSNPAIIWIPLLLLHTISCLLNVYGTCFGLRRKATLAPPEPLPVKYAFPMKDPIFVKRASIESMNALDAFLMKVNYSDSQNYLLRTLRVLCCFAAISSLFDALTLFFFVQPLLDSCVLIFSIISLPILTIAMVLSHPLSAAFLGCPLCSVIFILTTTMLFQAYHIVWTISIGAIEIIALMIFQGIIMTLGIYNEKLIRFHISHEAVIFTIGYLILFSTSLATLVLTRFFWNEALKPFMFFAESMSRGIFTMGNCLYLAYCIYGNSNASLTMLMGRKSSISSVESGGRKSSISSEDSVGSLPEKKGHY